MFCSSHSRYNRSRPSQSKPSQPKQGQSGQSQSKPSQNSNGRKPATKPGQNYSSDRTNTKSLGAMSDKERMDYYRKKYGFEPKKKSQEAPAKKQPKEVQKEEKPKKIGFFKRLFGRRK